MPCEAGSLTNAVTAAVELFQLSGLAGDGLPVHMLDERSCMMKSATGLYFVIVSVTVASRYTVIVSGVCLTALHGGPSNPYPPCPASCEPTTNGPPAPVRPSSSQA